jgi:hypothetical protein
LKASLWKEAVGSNVRFRELTSCAGGLLLDPACSVEIRQFIDKPNAPGRADLVPRRERRGPYAKKKNQDFLFDTEILFIDRCLPDYMPPGSKPGDTCSTHCPRGRCLASRVQLTSAAAGPR